MNKRDEFFMDKAILQAKVALRHGEVPVGAVIVDTSGQIISRAYNKIEKVGCQTGHAEVLAIQKACKKIGDWRLDGCWLYVTLEPCLMCFGLIHLSRIKGVVFGAGSEYFGSGLSAKDFTTGQYNKNLIIKNGLKEEESIMLLKEFFINLRRKKRKVKK
jgi:tRNA(adenine34) deaminase